MPFPESARVVYELNPLEQVICQLRFPPILRIDSEAPTAFQERIRREYPLFAESSGISQATTTLKLPAELTRLLTSGLLSMGRTAVREFSSADAVWKASLTRESLALTCSRYERWEDFSNHLAGPLEALSAEYSPAFFVRVGLRYVNVIHRSEYGLTDVPWAELLEPHIAATLMHPEIASSVEHAAHETVIRLRTNNARVRLKHGLAMDDDEQVYVIDSDFFTDERVETQHVSTTLQDFNRRAGRLFRSCIRDRLHAALRPKPIS
ncbi:MAG TPA: TIGR04255 family protein [Polyangiaceae bacterium]|nr:TIGR04255 family protein [Polyangiaceae bacterium]